MVHKYRVGARVIFNPITVAGVSRVYAGTYVVLRQLPPQGDQPQYHIEHVGDGHVRVASEFELSGANAWP
jgi:hypothetical protein